MEAINNPNFNRLLCLVAYLLSLVLLLLIISCNPTKKSQRLAQKTLVNKDAFDIVAAKAFELNPCPPIDPLFIDTGKPYIVEKQVLKPFAVPYKIGLDTIVNDISVYIDTLGNFFVKNLNHCDTFYIPYTKYYLDARLQQNYKDTINYYKQQTAEIAAKYAETKLNKKDENKLHIKEKNSWLWLFIAALVALIVSNGFWLYGKFKIPKI